MEQNCFRLTVYFEAPFWVGVFEREAQGRLEACKLVFGAEPRDCEVYGLVLARWRSLVFGPPVAAKAAAGRPNARRARRLAATALECRGTGTRAQEAIKQQQEQGKQERRAARRERDEAAAERKFQLRQQKKKEKRRGR